MGRYKYEEASLERTNEMLMQELQERGISNLQLSSMGNSISTGFSLMNGNIPLLKRNTTLYDAAENYGIDLTTHQFSRSENNNDEHLLEWILTNKTEESFNADSRRDYYHHLQGKMPLLTEEEIMMHYPEKVERNKGIQDVLFEGDNETANIIIANVGTGAFLDNVTRKGKHKLTNGVAKDRGYIESILGMVQLNNRESYVNTQIYLCGAPRILKTPATQIFINRQLKSISKRYANVNYLPSFPRKSFYHNSERLPIPFPDTHYSEEEYLHHLNEVEKSIIVNYQMTDCIIDIDREFARRSKEIEFSDYKSATRDEILTTIEGYADEIEESGKDSKYFIHKTKEYLLERYPYDYYFLDKQAIKDCHKVLRKGKK